MDTGVLGVGMIAAGVIVWVIDRYAPAKVKPDPAGNNLEGAIADTIKAAKDLPFPSLLVALGFLLVLFSNDWIKITAG